MKKFFSYVSAFAMAMTFALGLTACSDDNSDNGGQQEKNDKMAAITDQYVKKVVYPTYESLANSSEALYTQIVGLRDKLQNGNLTDNDIKTASETFLAARQYWEKSEAWLYGPADVFGIDPHIDTWPLSKKGLATFFADHYKAIFIDNTDVDTQIETVSTMNNEDSWLGFHGLEFVLFRNGACRKASDFRGNETDTEFAAVNPNVTGLMELNFAIAVAGDLRDHCYWLECAWEGSNANAAHMARCNARPSIKAKGLTIDGHYRGESMLTLGTVEQYTSWRGVMGEILNAGCSNICDEVASQKMGQVYRCATGKPETSEEGETDSPDYIESPYSEKSFLDFYDNITSIKNSLYGNIDKDNYESASIMAYLKEYNSDLANELSTNLNGALNALTTCQNGRPFVKIAYSGTAAELATVKAAMDAVDRLNTTIVEVKDWIQKN